MPRTKRIPPPYLEKPVGQRTILDFYRKKDKWRNNRPPERFAKQERPEA